MHLLAFCFTASIYQTRRIRLLSLWPCNCARGLRHIYILRCCQHQSPEASRGIQRHPEAGLSQWEAKSQVFVVRSEHVTWKHHYALSNECGWWEGAGGPVRPKCLWHLSDGDDFPNVSQIPPFSPTAICPTIAAWLTLLIVLLWLLLLLIWQHLISPASSVMSCFQQRHFPADWTSLLWAPKFSLFPSFRIAISLKCFKHLFSCLASTSMMDAYLSGLGDIFISIGYALL